jgi:hypothetical protein
MEGNVCSFGSPPVMTARLPVGRRLRSRLPVLLATGCAQAGVFTTNRSLLRCFADARYGRNMDSGRQREAVLSFVSRLISQRTHRERDPASEGLPDESPVRSGQAGTPRPYRGLPPGIGAADRAVDAPEASPEPASGAGVGVAAGVPESVTEGADAAEPRVGPGPVSLKSQDWTPPRVSLS